MKTITSRTNPLYRQWLADIKHAGRVGHPVWLEGVHLCQAWLEHRGQPQWAIFALEAQGEQDIVALSQVVDPANQIWLPHKLIAGLSSLATAPVAMFVAYAEDQTIGSSHQAGPLAGSCVLLDDVQDPGNVGALLRVAAAAGIRSVYCGPGTAACWSPKVLRAGQGAQFALQISEAVNLVELLTDWQRSVTRPQVLVTVLDEHATSLYEAELGSNTAWVFGHEGRGVAPELVALADQKVFIPHDHKAVESLNVASAGAICLFEQRRQILRTNKG